MPAKVKPQVFGRNGTGRVLQLCYTSFVSKSVTSSFRMSEGLRDRLERTATHLGKRKNWVITRALDEFLDRIGREALTEEARRQSLAAGGQGDEDAEAWAAHASTGDWR
jgi:predicted DNA-binding protein